MGNLWNITLKGASPSTESTDAQIQGLGSFTGYREPRRNYDYRDVR